MPSGFSDTLVTNIPAPTPIREITGTNLVLADSDWSPNFPTSAALAAEFYTRATGQPLDGVINVDPIALSYVLQVVGSVQVPPYPQVVGATNTLLELNYIVNPRPSRGSWQGIPGSVRARRGRRHPQDAERRMDRARHCPGARRRGEAHRAVLRRLAPGAAGRERRCRRSHASETEWRRLARRRLKPLWHKRRSLRDPELTLSVR